MYPKGYRFHFMLLAKTVFTPHGFAERIPQIYVYCGVFYPDSAVKIPHNPIS